MIFGLLLLAVLLFLYARFVEPAWIVSTRHTVENAHVSAEADGLVVVQASDAHLGRYFTPGRLRRVVDRINREGPGLVVFTGDLIDNIRTYGGDLSEVSDILSGIRAAYGKFAVYGNHDYGANAHRSFKTVMEDAGFIVLVNEYASFPDLRLTVAGLDDFLLGAGGTEILSSLPEDTLNLLLCHEPDVFGRVCALGNVDLMLSGHSHGGQVCLPLRRFSYYPLLGSVHTRGMYTADNARGSRLYVNRGLGTTKLPLRFFAVPELSVFTLRAKK